MHANTTHQHLGIAADLPTRADLDAATARTAAAIADPSASLADVEHAAELEEAVHTAYLSRPGADAELQAEAEAELELELESAI